FKTLSQVLLTAISLESSNADLLANREALHNNYFKSVAIEKATHLRMNGWLYCLSKSHSF
ncbi:hypothetical protein, partial [Aerococcus urinae]